MPSRAAQVAQAFDDLANRYDAWYDTAGGRVLFDQELDALRPLLAGTVGPRIEVGAGSGRFATSLGLDVGLDLAGAPLLVARSHGLRVALGDGERLPFRDGALGVVVLVVTLCFADDPARVLAEAARVLRPGGRIVVGLVPLDSAWGRWYVGKGRAGHPFYRHARFLTVAEHASLLASAGLRIVASRSALVRAPTADPVAEPVRDGTVPGAGFVAFAAQRDRARAAT